MLGFGLGDYIILIALIIFPILGCGRILSEVREANKSDSIMHFAIACSLFGIFYLSVLTPLIASAFLCSNSFNRIVFWVYLSSHLCGI